MVLRSFLLAAASFCLAGMVQAADITIGVAGPVTGQYSAFGEQFSHGAEMAVKDINAAGGVLGKKLKLEMADDACDPKQAVTVANNFADAGVPFVAGHFCSGSSIPASSVYEEAGILQISPGSTNPELTEAGRWNVFRTCGRDDQQGKVAAEYITAHFKGKNIAIIHDKSAYGKGLAEETRIRLNEDGVTETLFESVTAGEKDYSALVTRLKSKKIDVLYFGGYHTEAGLIVRQMREAGLQTVLMGGDALVTTEFWTITGPVGTGTLFSFSPDPRKNPDVAKLVASFKAQGYEPEGYTLYTYASIQAWAQAANLAKSTDAKKVAKVLQENTFDTVLGDIGFDSKGDVTTPGYVFYKWADGAYEQIIE